MNIDASIKRTSHLGREKLSIEVKMDGKVWALQQAIDDAVLASVKDPEIVIGETWAQMGRELGKKIVRLLVQNAVSSSKKYEDMHPTSANDVGKVVYVDGQEGTIVRLMPAVPGLKNTFKVRLLAGPSINYLGEDIWFQMADYTEQKRLLEGTPGGRISATKPNVSQKRTEHDRMKDFFRGSDSW